MKNKKTIVALIATVALIGFSAGMVVFIRADSPLRPSDVRSAKPATYINERASETKKISGIADEEKTLTYESTVERNGKKDLYLDENRNKYYYNENGELTNYLQIWSDAEPQKSEAAAVMDEELTDLKETDIAEKNTVSETVPEVDPYAIKIPKEMLKTMTEDELRIATLAWQKGIELFGDRVADFELNQYHVSTELGNDSRISFAKKYGTNNCIYGQHFWIYYDWYGTLKQAGLATEAFEDVNPETLAEYTAESLEKMGREKMKEELSEEYPYEYYAARLKRKDDGKVYLLILFVGDGPYSYEAYFEL